MTGHVGSEPVEPELDAVVEVEAGLLAQVLDRALEFPGIALGTQLWRQARIDDQHEAIVVSHGRARTG